jgi:uncharacterized protein YggT (Ycf19 family)
MGKEDKMTDYRETRTSQQESGREGRIATFKATQLIWLLLGFLEALLALRFFFKLIGANPENTFASFLYGLTNLFVAPFASLTGAPSAGGMVFEFSTLIAMIVYALVGWGLERLVYVLFYRPRGPVSTKQTTVSDHTPAVSATGTRTTITEDTNTRLPTDTP